MMASIQSHLLYNIQFEGRCRDNFHLTIWDSDAPRKCQCFAWHAVLGRCLTADNLQKHGWPNDPICPLRHVQPETTPHLLLNCSFARQVWRLIFAGINFIPPAGSLACPQLSEWWSMMAGRWTAQNRRRWNSTVALV